MTIQTRYFLTYCTIFTLALISPVVILAINMDISYEAFSKLMMLTAILPSIIALLLGIRAGLYHRDFRFATTASVLAAVMAFWIVTGMLNLFGVMMDLPAEAM
ncbi:hypothetical protein GF420_15385 [candidate division GN15 bacterium]|nr:hypothetical protein [candidate division GN15 bacterium]